MLGTPGSGGVSKHRGGAAHSDASDEPMSFEVIDDFLRGLWDRVSSTFLAFWTGDRVEMVLEETSRRDDAEEVEGRRERADGPAGPVTEVTTE